MPAQFKHFDLIITEPSFGSRLTDLIIELDYLRKKRLGGTTHPVEEYFSHLREYRFCPYRRESDNYCRIY